jgi:DNA repair exonuclease SbcCD ATPase subunit
MDNQYMTFWQNAITDMFEKSSQFKQMDKLIEQSFSSFEDLTTMVQKMSRWDLFFNPIESTTMFDFRKNMADYLKIMGLISIDEYRSLVNKYEELKNDYQKLDQTCDEQKKKITDLNQSMSNEKKKTATKEKSVAENKSLADKMKTELANEKKQTTSLEKEVTELKKLIDTLKKDISDKEKALAKRETAKA